MTRSTDAPFGTWARAASASAILWIALAGVVLAWPRQVPFRARVETVRVDVLAMDNGHPIAGLRPADFEVTDGGVTQTVDFVAPDDGPIDVALALDVSGSVEGRRLDELRRAGNLVAGAMKANDQIALLTFATVVSVRVPLTSDAARVGAALAEKPGSLGADTALVDASYAAMVAGESDFSRELTIVFSDGLDTASFLTPDAVIRTASRMNAVVYAVSAGGSRASFLRDLCRETGGRLIDTESMSALGTMLAGIVNEFRQRYIVSYTPQGVPGAGWHPITVRVKGRRASITARRGYMAGESPLDRPSTAPPSAGADDPAR